jgi:hypothetical protein
MTPSIVTFIQDPYLAQEFGRLQKTMLDKNADEVISKVTRMGRDRTVSLQPEDRTSLQSDALSVDDEHARRRKVSEARQRLALSIINCIAYVTIMLSLLIWGLSLDYATWRGWKIVELTVSIIFVFEFFSKNLLLGPREYWRGRERYSNWLDAFITLAAVVDSVFQNIVQTNVFETGRLGGVMRIMRLTRIVRLLKLLRMPFLQDFTRMLTGLFIGAPWLVSTIVLLTVVTYIVALGLRTVVGTDPNVIDMAAIRAKCGKGDAIEEAYRNVSGHLDSDECPIHKLLGEEFFSSVRESMFTVFRCLISDCTTTAGENLVVHLSKGYGVLFQVVYGFGMTVIIFGVFNVITAIFVDATVSGMKTDHQRRRNAKLYEVRYVRSKLEGLACRVRDLISDKRGRRQNRGSVLGSLLKFGGIEIEDELKSASSAETILNEHEMVINDTNFSEVIQDEEVTNILEDLDVECSGREYLFDMFDTDGDGKISIPDLLETIVKMRGEVRKSDIVANWLALRALREKFDSFQMVMLANQGAMMEYQAQMRTNQAELRSNQQAMRANQATMLSQMHNDHEQQAPASPMQQQLVPPSSGEAESESAQCTTEDSSLGRDSLAVPAPKVGERKLSFGGAR